VSLTGGLGGDPQIENALRDKLQATVGYLSAESVAGVVEQLKPFKLTTRENLQVPPHPLRVATQTA
jgi:hypothetical protein